MTRDYSHYQLVLPRLGIEGRHVILSQTRLHWLGRLTFELNHIVNMAMTHFLKSHVLEVC